MNPLLKKAYEASCQGQSFAFATIMDSTLKGTPRKPGAKMVVLADGTIFGSIGGGANEQTTVEHCLKAIRRQKTKILSLKNYGKKGQPICGGEMKVFIEPFIKTRQLILCGAGHIALPLSVLGKMLQFDVTVIDNRKEFANPQRFPHVDRVIKGPYEGTLNKLSINNNTYIVILTHGHELDFECLKTVIETDAAYIGVISSHTKKLQFQKDLKKKGHCPKSIKRIQMPIGLDIGAQTPEEIAVSIGAQIIATYNEQWLHTKKFQKAK